MCLTSLFFYKHVCHASMPVVEQNIQHSPFLQNFLFTAKLENPAGKQVFTNFLHLTLVNMTLNVDL